MSDEVKLLPCPIPWCAKSKPELMQGGFRNGSFVVRCKTCGCETPRFYDPRFAISKWNTRAIEATRPTEQGLGAISGSHPTDQAPSGLGASRFDPERCTCGRLGEGPCPWHDSAALGQPKGTGA